MPIINYEERAKKDEEIFFNLKTISDSNKDIIRKFLDVYKVRPATRSKFLKHFRFLAELIDIKNDLMDREKINRAFNEMEKNLKPGYMSTIINVSKRFAMWFNDKQLPKSFMDIKKASKKSQMRKLSPQDMWSWEDGKKVAEYTKDIQFKAIILTQLDAGMRPSEFVDLNYGDVIIKKDIIIFNIKDGKTGARSCPCHRCVPAFLKWYNAHPTKKDKDPLWISRDRENHIQRYNYFAILKRLRTYIEALKMKRHYDFYTLRHSSCALDKKEGLPVEFAAKRHGHSVAYFTEVYGRLDVDDLANIMREHYGGEREKIKRQETIVCERCGNVVEKEQDRCDRCGSPMSLKVALEEQEKQIQEMTERVVEELYKKEKTKELEELKAK